MTSVKRLRAALAIALGLSAAVLAFSAAPALATFGIEPGSFKALTTGEDGNDLTQAGGRPDGTTDFEFNTILSDEGVAVPEGDVRDIRVELPPGFVGDPVHTPKCLGALFVGGGCPPETQVGVGELVLSEFPGFPPVTEYAKVYNVVPPEGTLARLGFGAVQGLVAIPIDITLRPGDHGITATVHTQPGGAVAYGTKITLWGVPMDSSHDEYRKGCYDLQHGAGWDQDAFANNGKKCPVSAPRVPFLSNGTQCGQEATTVLEVDSYQHPGVWARAEAKSPPLTGCNKVDFKPSLSVKPTTTAADTPTGLAVELTTPQNQDPDGFATAHLKKATLTFPQGMTVNASSAGGLGACTPAQIGLGTDSPIGCPDSSKLGTVEIETPLLADTVPGEIYLASQEDNPFDSLLALYIVARLPNGQFLKLPGKATTDPQTGQLTASFDENPQLPFEHLRVTLFNGPRAALKTPNACATYTTTSQITPWSAPEGATMSPTDSFAISRGANGDPCLAKESEAPNKPAFEAGTLDPAAATYSPFALKLSRQDGSAPLKAIETTLPPGLLGKLAGVPYCPEAALQAAANRKGAAEQAQPSCPQASQIGVATIAAGAGINPIHVGARAYLTGPYKGAPLSMAIITPALAGPFDLGTVVVRTALAVDPQSAQIKATSDPIPTILQGIPLDIRQIALSLDRPAFTLNPTSCDPMSILASATSVFDRSASLSNPFQVGGCPALAFKPKLALKLTGPTHRSAYPALRATLTMPKGNANIARAQVTLPKTEILEQAHIKTICTRVQYAAKSCPAKSVYGYAKAFSPLLDQPLQGPVYLRSSSHELPDLVASLQGQIHVDLVGRIDSKKARIRNTFEALPDAPVSKFVLTMQGGKKGLLVNNTELCKAKPRAKVLFDGQNGKTADSQPLVAVGCGKQGKHEGKHRR